ncbi:MAG: aromatic amino acid lyase [Alphaproteobacteria bacterium]
MTVMLNTPDDFNLETVRRVAWQGEPVSFGPDAIATMTRARAAFLNLLEKEPGLHIYGVTTWYGDGASKILSREDQQKLAKNPSTIISTGMGPHLPARAVRAMIFTRMINYVAGRTGISLTSAKRICAMLDGRPLPEMPVMGQDSPGELLQLLSLFHTVRDDQCEVRDQNGMSNGSGCAPGLLADTALRARRLARLMTRVFALSIDAAGLNMDPWDPALKPLIVDRHEQEAIDLLNASLAGIETTGRRTWQPPISWRILTRMIGHVLRTVGHAEEMAKTALLAVNDNPTFFYAEESPPNGRVVSTGGFHVPYAYHSMNGLSAAWAEMCVLAARESAQLHKHSVTGLPENLWVGGTRFSTRQMIVPAHDIASRARAFAIPALIPLHGGSDGQTDTAMPLFEAYEKETKAGEHLGLCMAILAASASQALHVAGREPAPPLRPFLAEVRDHFPPVTSARNLGADTERLAVGFSDAIVNKSDDFGFSA